MSESGKICPLIITSMVLGSQFILSLCCKMKSNMLFASGLLFGVTLSNTGFLCIHSLCQLRTTVGAAPIVGACVAHII